MILVMLHDPFTKCKRTEVEWLHTLFDNVAEFNCELCFNRFA